MGEARQLHPFVLSLRKGRRASGGDPPAYPLRVLSKHERSAKPKPSGVARQLVTFFCFAKKKVTKEKVCTDHTHR